MNKTEHDKWWDSLSGWKMTLVIFASWPILALARGFWQSNPGFFPCLLFWTMQFMDEPIQIKRLSPRRKMIYSMCLIGMVGNAIATLSNGGFMPVLGETEYHGLWSPMTPGVKFYYFCDIIGGASIGDFFILTGLGGLLLNCILEKRGLIQLEEGHKIQKIPCMGMG